jgi:hypothetical protein
MTWTRFDEALPPNCCYAIVWDTRTDEPRGVVINSQGTMTEENGRMYEKVGQLFYSYWCVIPLILKEHHDHPMDSGVPEIKRE